MPPLQKSSFPKEKSVYAKLCIPIEYHPEGGMYTFIANLTAYMEAHGIPFTCDIGGGYDMLFVNSWVVSYEDIRRVKRARPQVRVVQRVDGSARDYGRYDTADEKQARVNLLADQTIFQSNYSRYSAMQKYRVISQDGPVIYNPVDIQLFKPDGPRLNLPPGRVRVASACWSTDPKKGTWQIDHLAEENPDIDFVLCGQFVGISSRSNVHFLGHLNREQMAAALRSCDLFLNLSENDSCPNVVLEALASGLPVLHKNSGGVPELVGDCGLPIELHTFRQGLEQLLDRRDDLSSRARQRAVTCFAPDVIFPQYLAVMESVERRPLPSQWTVLKLAASGYPVLAHPPKRSLRQWAGAAYRRLYGFFGPAIRQIDRLSPSVESGRRRITRRGIESFLRREVTDTAGPVLDLGGGAGTYARVMPSSTLRLDLRSLPGVDIVADAHYLPFADESFGSIVCAEVLEHLENPRQAVSEMKRILRPGGKVILTARFIFPIHNRPHDFYRFTRYGLEKLFSGFELSIVEQHSAFMTALAGYVSLVVEPRLKARRFLAPLILVSALAMTPLDVLFGRLIPDDYATSGYLMAAGKPPKESQESDESLLPGPPGLV